MTDRTRLILAQLRPDPVLSVARFRAQGYIAITFVDGRVVRLNFAQAEQLGSDLLAMVNGGLIETNRSCRCRSNLDCDCP